MNNRESRLQPVGCLSGTPDPAEAGIPEQQYLDETFNVQKTERRGMG
jgi:hypothetical protein